MPINILNKLSGGYIIKIKFLIFLFLFFSKNLFATNFFTWEKLIIDNNDLKIESFKNSFYGAHNNIVILSNGFSDQDIYYSHNQKFWSIEKKNYSFKLNQKCFRINKKWYFLFKY